MKIRIGYGFGVRTGLNDESFGTVVDALERLHFDSLWLSERIGGAAPDPLVAMSYAAGRTKKLKVGMSVMVLPGHNPVVLAKQLATLDRLSDGRLLPGFGLGAAARGAPRAGPEGAVRGPQRSRAVGGWSGGGSVGAPAGPLSERLSRRLSRRPRDPH
jgi:alkanesulfonate monooxygenase SsuD/methylene tetrahydromethanopterin reductase-like flavin-dependent oxidoreductase (luciferase family)